MNKLDTLKYSALFIRGVINKFQEGSIARKELSKLSKINLDDLYYHLEAIALEEGLDPQELRLEKVEEKRTMVFPTPGTTARAPVTWMRNEI